MKNTCLGVIAFAFLFLGGFAVNSSAQIAGGYSETSPRSGQVKAAAQFAVGTEAKRDKKKLRFVMVSKAEQQVVAGMNYKMCLKVRDGKRVRQATAVVYQDLKNKLSLSEWNWDKCEL